MPILEAAASVASSRKDVTNQRQVALAGAAIRPLPRRKIPSGQHGAGITKERRQVQTAELSRDN